MPSSVSRRNTNSPPPRSPMLVYARLYADTQEAHTNAPLPNFVHTHTHSRSRTRIHASGVSSTSATTEPRVSIARGAITMENLTAFDLGGKQWRQTLLTCAVISATPPPIIFADYREPRGGRRGETESTRFYAVDATTFRVRRRETLYFSTSKNFSSLPFSFFPPLPSNDKLKIEQEKSGGGETEEEGEERGRIDNVPFYFWGNDLALKGAEIRFAGRGVSGTLANLAFVSFRNWRSGGQEKEKRREGRRRRWRWWWWEKERGRLLRRRNSKAGTYASFIKEIASKDCCFAHGYVSLALARLGWLPSPTTAAAFYTAVIIIVSVPLQQAFELRRVYIQFVSRNYNLSGIGARRCGRNREQPLSACLTAVDTISILPPVFAASFSTPNFPIRTIFERVLPPTLRFL